MIEIVIYIFRRAKSFNESSINCWRTKIIVVELTALFLTEIFLITFWTHPVLNAIQKNEKKKKEIYIDILQNTNRYCRYIAITANWSGVHVARLGLGCKMCLEYSAIENISAICEVSVIIFTDTFQ